MERNFEYPAKIEQDEAGFYLVTFPNFPEAATDARSLNEALAAATDCLEEAVASRMKRGEDIPAPSPAQNGSVIVVLPALYAMKAALYDTMRKERLSETALASKLHKGEKEVRRLLDPSHATRTSAIETALRVIGQRVRVTVEDIG